MIAMKYVFVLTKNRRRKVDDRDGKQEAFRCRFYLKVWPVLLH